MQVNRTLKYMTDSELIIEVEESKEYLDDYEQRFCESVCEFYYEKGFITEEQRKWLVIYTKRLSLENDIAFDEMNVVTFKDIKHPDEDKHVGEKLIKN